MRVAFALFPVLLLVPRWAGEEKLALPAPGHRMTVRPVSLHPGNPAVDRVGRLRYLGGIALKSSDPAFGGFSSVLVEGDRFALLGDGGNLLRFRMGADRRPREVRFDPVPAGPGTGWSKSDRDSESMAFDPQTGAAWVGFESANEIWRYRPGLAGAVRGRAPPAMANWPGGGGAEAMARFADGRFAVLAEGRNRPDGARIGLLFAGDPTDRRVRVAGWGYRPARGLSPVDMAELPDGRVLVLERGFALPFRWTTRLALVDRGAIRAGAVVAGRTVAGLVPPLVSDNFEGVAVTREGGATIVWLVSDDNQLPIQRSLLLKFRLE